MTSPRYISIDLEWMYEIRQAFQTSITLGWKGSQISALLRKEATRLGALQLHVADKKQGPFRTLEVEGEWRDGQAFHHPGMVVDSLAPNVVDTALLMFLQTASA